MIFQGTWLAPLVERATLDLGVCEFGLHVGCGAYFKEKQKQKKPIFLGGAIYKNAY